MQGFLSDMPEFSDNNQYSSKRTLKDRKFQVHIDRSRDDNLSAFGKTVLQDRYLVENEGFQDLFARVAGYYADSPEHAQRLYDAMSKLWFMPATPILSNGGTRRGLPISCFLNESGDSIHEIVDTWNENVWLAAKGGGIGTYWGECAINRRKS